MTLEKRPAHWAPGPDDRKRLLDFVGYGPDDPDVAFIGLEEYCSADAGEARDNIWIRCKHSAFASERADKNDALGALSDVVKSEVPVWNVMAEIMAQLTQSADVPKEYQDLGTRPASGTLTTLLMELRPLPRPATGRYRGTYIEEWFKEEFGTRAEYERASEARTRARLRVLFRAESGPRYLFGYGAPTCRLLAELASEASVSLMEKSNTIRVGRTKPGCLIALTGFYDRQDTRFRPEHVPALMSALASL